MEGKKLLPLFGILVLISVGCATNISPKGDGSDVIAESPVLVMDSKFVFQRKDVGTGRISTYTWVVKEKKKYKNVDAYWVDTTGGAGEVYWVSDSSFNFMGYFRKGKQLEEISPAIQRFNWPLKVGKSWRFSYDSWDHTRGTSAQGVINSIKVESYEEVKVPAGTFQAFKIFRRGEVLRETYYFAPSIGMTIKVELLRDAGGGYLDELLEYSIPGK